LGRPSDAGACVAKRARSASASFWQPPARVFEPIVQQLDIGNGGYDLVNRGSESAAEVVHPGEKSGYLTQSLLWFRFFPVRPLAQAAKPSPLSAGARAAAAALLGLAR